MLKHIQHDKCPDCQSELQSEAVRNQHCNGHWNEERRFACGAAFEFSPNFMKVAQSKACTRTDKYKLARKKREDAKSSLEAHIGGLDVDKEFKKKLMDEFKYTSVD